MYVTIDGAHGIGKTTICERISEKYGWDFVRELKDNLLPPPKLGPGEDAFLAQMWFLRQLALKDNIVSRKGNYISDRSQGAVYIYSKESLDDYELEIFKTLVQQLDLKQPDCEIILHCDDEIIMERIKVRGRNDWSEENSHYLKRINSAMKEYYESYKNVKNIHLVDASGSIEDNQCKVEDVLLKYIKQ